MPDASGIYLGLDTLNMDGSKGTNLQIGGSTSCEMASDSLEWLEEKMTYGERHLISGLHKLRKVYSQPKWEELYEFSDYILFLTYSGIVLEQAFVRLRFPNPLLVVWGFHNGDIFILGRNTGDHFELVCK